MRTCGVFRFCMCVVSDYCDLVFLLTDGDFDARHTARGSSFDKIRASTLVSRESRGSVRSCTFSFLSSRGLAMPPLVSVGGRGSGVGPRQRTARLPNAFLLSIRKTNDVVCSNYTYALHGASIVDAFTPAHTQPQGQAE